MNPVDGGWWMIFIVSAFSLWISRTYAFANPRIRNLKEEIPDEPDEVERGLGEEEKQPMMQTSSG